MVNTRPIRGGRSEVRKQVFVFKLLLAPTVEGDIKNTQNLNTPLQIQNYRGILVYNICLISKSNTVSDGAKNKPFVNIERS